MKTYFIKDDDFSENDHQMNESATRFDKLQANHNFFYFYTHVDNKRKTVKLFFNAKSGLDGKQMSYKDSRKMLEAIKKEITSTNSDLNTLYDDANDYEYVIL